MLIFRGGNWPEHRPWFLGIVMVSVAAAVWYAVEGFRSGSWPGGSSTPGFVFGVAGGLIIVFEMLLWVRKKIRVVRLGRAKLWMKAHIWLGLLSLPLLVLHSGFAWLSAPLSGILMAVFLVVIASGIWGLALQQVVPTMMLEELPAETIHSQIDYLIGQLLNEARRLVRVTCGSDDPALATRDYAALSPEDQTFLIIGAVRTAGKVQGKVLQTRAQATSVSGSAPLVVFFEENVVPFFEAKRIGRLPLASAKRSAAMFRELKTWLDPAAHGVVDTLEDLCDQRRQFARQDRLHFWLHAWLCVHLPLSVALLVLMVFHVVYALKYL